MRRLPDEIDQIYRRLIRDLERIEPADAALIEDKARWIVIAKRAYAELALETPAAERTPNQGLTVPDTTHGDGTEMRKNPLLIVLRTASEQIRANAHQLGATPMSRARLPEQQAEQLSLADILFASVDQRE